MAEHQIRFDDGVAYERMMGAWSRLAGGTFLDWIAPRPGLQWVDVGCGNGAFTEPVFSGSPLLADDSSAIGIVCISAGNDGSDHPHTEGGPNPRLIGNLPGLVNKSLSNPNNLDCVWSTRRACARRAFFGYAIL
ncbi:hypothetical protein SAMN05444169_5577 [Bradyrhizobium erythrophlei]|jgi:hypothetical protein|uniref:Methyltransferase n=1 Tax=Bradyrhizobium erythrophlei TaxID=1437360 RepID=A0A1M5PZQ0_9BRAD|nr:hypothetical protein SAMN05444169_5577 [Bradyrhizobium erythrophlei]